MYLLSIASFCPEKGGGCGGTVGSPKVVVKRVSAEEAKEDAQNGTSVLRRYNDLCPLRFLPPDLDEDCLSRWYPLVEGHMKAKIVWRYELTASEQETLRECTKFMAAGGSHLSALFREDIEEMIARLQAVWVPGEWMARLDQASFKGSLIWPPYRTPREVIEAMATSARSYGNCFQNESKRQTNRTIYFSPWDHHWDVLAEWRIFVYDRQVIAISQYAIYQAGPWKDRSEEELQAVGRLLITYAQDLMTVIPLPTVTIDVYYDGRAPPQIVEFNNFYYSGSGYLSWTYLLARIKALDSEKNVEEDQEAKEQKEKEIFIAIGE